MEHHETTPAHTRGPWTVERDPETWGKYTVIEAQRQLAAMELGYEDREPIEAMDHANARLIAAAPDLLDACRLAVISMREALDGGHPGWMDDMGADLDFIEKAITKTL